VNVEDNSGGCGEKYAVLIVSKVLFFPLNSDGRSDSKDWTMICQDFEGKTTLARHRMGI
jgi:stress-induced morphogen